MDVKRTTDGQVVQDQLIPNPQAKNLLDGGDTFALKFVSGKEGTVDKKEIVQTDVTKYTTGGGSGA